MLKTLIDFKVIRCLKDVLKHSLHIVYADKEFPCAKSLNDARLPWQLRRCGFGDRWYPTLQTSSNTPKCFQVHGNCVHARTQTLFLIAVTTQIEIGQTQIIYRLLSCQRLTTWDRHPRSQRVQGCQSKPGTDYRMKMNHGLSQRHFN